jgi:hypothetical protein
MLGGLVPGAARTQQVHARRRQTGRVAEHLEEGRQDARISTSTECSGPARSPKRVDAVRVTVPPTAWWPAPASSRAPVSQLHATSENIASSTSVSSVTAET